MHALSSTGPTTPKGLGALDSICHLAWPLITTSGSDEPFSERVIDFVSGFPSSLTQLASTFPSLGAASSGTIHSFLQRSLVRQAIAAQSLPLNVLDDKRLNIKADRLQMQMLSVYKLFHTA